MRGVRHQRGLRAVPLTSCERNHLMAAASGDLGFAQGPRHGLDQRRAQRSRKAAAARVRQPLGAPRRPGGCSECAWQWVRPPAAQVDFTLISSSSLNNCMSLKQQAATQIQVSLEPDFLGIKWAKPNQASTKFKDSP